MQPDQRPVTGRFAYDVATGKWDWDDEVYRLHGIPAGSAEPTLDLVLDMVAPESRERIAGLLDEMARTSQPFSASYRLAGQDEEERLVAIVGERAMCEDGVSALIEGYFIDLTNEVKHEVDDAARAAVEASAEHRAAIEQVKGAIMLAYGLDDEAAFAMLRWWSRHRNVKVRDLSHRLVEFLARGEVSNSQLRVEIDRMLHDLSNPRDSGS